MAHQAAITGDLRFFELRGSGGGRLVVRHGAEQRFGAASELPRGPLAVSMLPMKLAQTMLTTTPTIRRMFAANPRAPYDLRERFD